MPLFDTHAHYYDEKFGSPEEQETLLCDVLKEVPRIINCGITPSTSEICLGWAKKHAGLFAACGLHPENISGSRAENVKMLDGIYLYRKISRFCVICGVFSFMRTVE